MFVPPRCPNPSCPRHDAPTPRFFVRRGSYWPKCRPRPVPRFRCKTCARGFSRQTFRADYRDHKPHLNVDVARLLCSGIGLRQLARVLGLTRRNARAKFEKLARHATWLDHNLKLAPRESRAAVTSAPRRLHFDEFETYEGRRNTRPLSVAVMIESSTRLIIAAAAAPIRPRGRRTAAREAAIEREESRWGPRRDRSRLACRWVFRRAARTTPAGSVVVLRSDEKGTYPALARDAFRGRRLVHLRTSSRVARDTRNPLFPINHTEALLRDLVGRLRRRSWLGSKRRDVLNLHLGLYAAWRNWVRPRFNFDRRSPGELAGLAARRLTPGELTGWRQDWGRSSPRPTWRGRASARGE